MGCVLKKNTIRKLLGEVGKDFFPYIIEIKKADMAAQSDYKLEERQSQLAELEKKYEDGRDTSETAGYGYRRPGEERQGISAGSGKADVGISDTRRKTDK